MSFSFHLACYMSDKAAFVRSVYSRLQCIVFMLDFIYVYVNVHFILI